MRAKDALFKLKSDSRDKASIWELVLMATGSRDEADRVHNEMWVQEIINRGDKTGVTDAFS